jgi:hypothetical protein
MSRNWICEVCGWSGSGTARSIHADKHRKYFQELLKTKRYLTWRDVVYHAIKEAEKREARK